MIHQLQQPVNPAFQGGAPGEFLIQQNEQDMTEEEFEQLQAALVASMGQGNEDIHIAEDDEGDAVNANPGMMQ